MDELKTGSEACAVAELGWVPEVLAPDDDTGNRVSTAAELSCVPVAVCGHALAGATAELGGPGALDGTYCRGFVCA